MESQPEGKGSKSFRLNLKHRMKLKHLLSSLITGMTLFLNFSSTAQTSPEDDFMTLLENGEVDELIFRIGLENYPINYANPTRPKELIGFCNNFAEALEKKLNQDFRKDSLTKIRVIKVSYDILDDPRFETISKKEAHIQCSSDTRRSKNDKFFTVKNDQDKTLGSVIFSDTFFETGARLLVKKEKAKELSLNDLTFGNVRIGVVKNTTTLETFEKTYRRANIEQIYDKRGDVVDSLNRNEIDAFASDDIILQGILKEDFNNQNYILFPERFLSDEPYAMVINKDNNLLRHYVNGVLKDEKDRALDYLKKEGFDLTYSKQYDINSWFILFFVIIAGSIILLSVIVFFTRILWNNKRDFIYLKYQGNDFNFPAFLYTLKEMNYHQNIPLKIQKNSISNSAEKFSINLPIPQNTNKEQFHQQFCRIYRENKNRKESEFSQQYENTKEMVRLEENLRNFLGKTGYREISLIFNLGTMTNDKIKQSHSGSGDNVAGDKNTTNIHNSQDLKQAAAEIQALLGQLERTYRTNTTTGKMAIATEVIKHIDNDPNLTQRILSAFGAGGVSAFEQLLNHPAASFVIGALDDWQQNKNN